MTPDQAARGAAFVPDKDLPMLAARWLADGLDSEPLRALAALTRRDRVEARRLLPEVLSSLGIRVPRSDTPWDQLPWRGNWSGIEWAQRELDHRLSPYAAAQRVLEVAGDVPGLWEPAGGAEIMRLLARWDAEPESRAEVDDLLRARVRALREEDVPPVVG